jgi:hypothetical protein
MTEVTKHVMKTFEARLPTEPSAPPPTPSGPPAEIPEEELPPRNVPVEDPAVEPEAPAARRKSRKKAAPTSEELEEISRLESEGGLYNGDRDS